MKEDLREAVHAWIREDCGVGLKMLLTRDVADALLDRLALISSAKPGWQDMGSAPADGTRILVNFKGAGPLVVFKTEPDSTVWVRYLGYFWPSIHEDYALGWMPLPAAPTDTKED